MFSQSDLKSKTVVELKAICKEHGFKSTGKKDDLISFIVNETKVRAKARTVTKSPKEYNGKQDLHRIEVHLNEHCNYEYEGLVFDLDKRVQGVQLPDGNVRVLNSDDIDRCKRYLFEYVLPKNLGTIEYREDDDSNSKEFLQETMQRLNICKKKDDTKTVTQTR